MTAPLKDHDLKRLIAGEVGKALRTHQFRVDGLHSVQVRSITPLVLEIRVRAEHPQPRGQKYHHYSVKVSENAS